MTSLLDGVLPGTRLQWIVLGPLLAIAGYAAARSRGANAVLGAQRALPALVLVVLAQLVLAVPFHAPDFGLAAAPVAGGAIVRQRPHISRNPKAWLYAAAFATPASLLGLLGYAAAAPVGFVLALSALALKGVLDPVWPPIRSVRMWWTEHGQDLAVASRRALVLLAGFAIVALALRWPVSPGLFALAGLAIAGLALTKRGAPGGNARDAWLRALLIAAAAIAIATLGG